MFSLNLLVASMLSNERRCTDTSLMYSFLINLFSRREKNKEREGDREIKKEKEGERERNEERRRDREKKEKEGKRECSSVIKYLAIYRVFSAKGTIF